MRFIHVSSIILAGIVCFVQSAFAETRVTYKSAKSTSSYYQMGVQIAEAMKQASSGQIIVTVEESQGSVQNVMEAAVRQGNYVFTTMHFVLRADSGVTKMSDLAGKTLLLGKGSFGAREGAKYLKLFGLEGKVKLANVELNNAVPALKNRQIDGFVTAGSYPAPNVIEAAAGTGITVLSMTSDQVKKSKRTRLVIPAGTYPGVNQDIVTTSLPVVAYTISQMSDETAYELTKNFWKQNSAMANTAAWWKGVTPKMLENVYGKIHDGALRYYDEIGVSVPAANR